MFNLEIGKYLVKTAREVIEVYLQRGIKKVPERVPTKELLQKRGVFVTLKRFRNNELRGCIGFPLPIYPLIQALTNAAIAAATEDPRFHAVTWKEMKEIIIEVSVLTPPQPIDKKQVFRQIKIGRDGLIIKKGPFSGLLLPQVPVEENWSTREFLSYTCLKAGLNSEAWLDPETEIYKFQAQIFSETQPGGEVVEKVLGEH